MNWWTSSECASNSAHHDRGASRLSSRTGDRRPWSHPASCDHSASRRGSQGRALGSAFAGLLASGDCRVSGPLRPAPGAAELASRRHHGAGARGKRVLRLVAALALLFVYYKAIQPLGMVVASMAAIFVFGLLGRARNLPVLAVTAILLPLLLYGFFVKIAGLPIPTGRWISFP
ncbi:MAG: tripartite tricarboxylate transporter TctB family protein [Geminicoccaceae bacterium]